MKKKGLMAIGLLTVLLNANAQDVSTYTPGAMPEGVVYYLPKTLLEVKVKVTQTNYTPGELCQYADRYLRLQNISSQPTEEWAINSIEVKAIGVRDTAKAYSVKLKEKNLASEVELTPDGIIKAINTTSPAPTTSPEPKVAPTANAKRLNPRNFMTEEMLLAGSSNKMAELIAKEIYSIRESKNNLNRGQADYMPKDGAAMQIMLNNLEEQERALTEMFSGITTRQEHVFTFHFEPQKEEVIGEVLFRFSKKLGVLQADNYAGEPIYISLAIKERILAPAEPEGAKKKDTVEGIIYNIPGKGKVYIEASDKNFFEGEFPITQFGETEVLVNSLFTKKVNTRVIFNPITGGISKIDKD